MSRLTPEQYNYLLQQIDPKRVQLLRGMSHLEAWDVRRTLNRIFGIGGWDQEILSKDLAHCVGVEKPRRDAEKPGRQGSGTYTAWTVVYTVTLRLIIKDVNGIEICRFDEGAAGDSANQPSVGDAHDMALKTAISQALKRAAVNLGDQFGLSLYNGGGVDRVVHRTMNPPAGLEPPATPADLPVDEVKPEQQPATEPMPAPPASQPPAPEATGAEVRMVEQSQHRKMHALWREIGMGGDEKRAERLRITGALIKRPDLESSADLTFDQAELVIAKLVQKRDWDRRQAGRERTPEPVGAAA